MNELILRLLEQKDYVPLSAENLRNGRVWQWFMSNAEPAHALDLAGLVKVPAASTFADVVKVSR